MPNLPLVEIRKSLVGTWKLVSYTSKPARKDGPIEYPLGKDARGYIIYTADGYMSAQIMRPGSKPYSTMDDPFAIADDEAADAARHYLAYTGPFEVIEHEGKVAVKHHTNLALVPNWAGNHQLRFCELEGNELVLMPTQPWRLNTSFEAGDAKDKSSIDPRFFPHPLDIEIMARNLLDVERMHSVKPLSECIKPEGRRNRREAFLTDLGSAKKYLRNTATMTFHSCGPAAMLPHDQDGVVGESLRVHGTSNLRIVNASIFPVIPRSNLMATMYAVAERVTKLDAEE
ncbi:hypothetical protein ZTR_01579 [Talaromyces verruculosus]|nr:hypothetical protein ZTR_01579 [Talaromyces verruculosus]